MKKIALLLVFAGLANACAASEPVFRDLKIGAAVAHVELARTPAERSRGLMFRETLAADSGMLFAFETAGRWSFWMRNTYIPLAIAFIARDGRILNIEELRPRDETPVEPVGDIVYALEMPAGWFHRNGITAGVRIEFPAGLKQELSVK